MLVADDGETEANTLLPVFFSISVFLLAAGVDGVFATWGTLVTWGFSIAGLLLDGTLLFPVVVTLFPVCRLPYVAEGTLQVLIVAVVSKRPAVATFIHGGLAVSLLERISCCH